eukprot:m.63069 g.63069  ORF g.63069 m.63069 type:complete len:625 (-) comp23236_c0_seq2:55-1929(-)
MAAHRAVAHVGDEAIPTPPRKKPRLDPPYHDEPTEDNGTVLMPQQHNTLDQRADEDSDVLPSPFNDGPGIDRTALVRLITESLRGLGYADSASLLEKESQIQCEPEYTTRFKAYVIAGEWPQALLILDSFEHMAPKDLQRAKFMLLEEKYLELLQAQRWTVALSCLREELQPLDYDRDRLHYLCGIVMLEDITSIQNETHWGGTGVQSRKNLLTQLEPMMPSSIMVPEKRLEKLLHQSWKYQCDKCIYHNADFDRVSLMENHKCKNDAVPRHETAVLHHHRDEVWFIAFSRSGRQLASASKDKTAVIWSVETRTVMHELVGHTAAVSYLAWSRDDTQLLTCGSEEDHSIKLWDTHTGLCVRTFKKHKQGVTACAWCIDGTSFVTGSTDNCMYQWSTNGDILHSWSKVGASDMVMSPDGEWLVVADNDKLIRLYNMKTKSEEKMSETASITSLTLSRDGKSALVNVSSEELHVWNVQSRKLAQKYYGHKQSRYAIRSCFGGLDDGFIASGSEDNGVYVWHRNTQTLLGRLEGHRRSVNCVAWHPADVGLLASASDDKTIRFWENSDNVTKLANDVKPVTSPPLSSSPSSSNPSSSLPSTTRPSLFSESNSEVSRGSPLRQMSSFS